MAERDRPDTDRRHEQFMKLFLQHRARVYSYIRGLVFNRTDAEELLQEVALVLWRKFDEFKPGTHFDRWALTVAFNQVRYHRQKQQRKGMVFNSDLVNSLVDEAEALHRKPDVFRDALEDCVRQLPGQDRDLLRQRYQGHATNRSLAQVLGRSESAISRALNRIHQALLRCVEGKTGMPRTGGVS